LADKSCNDAVSNLEVIYRRIPSETTSMVCPQSPFGVLKNCGAQTNWASHMRFAADYSETLEVFYWPQ
jgi:hypothetical protein